MFKVVVIAIRSVRANTPVRDCWVYSALFPMTAPLSGIVKLKILSYKNNAKKE